MKNKTPHRLYLRIRYLILGPLYWKFYSVYSYIKYTILKCDPPPLTEYNVPLIRLIRKPNIQVCMYCHHDNHVSKIEEELPYCMRCGGDYKYELGDKFEEGAEGAHRLMAFDLFGVQPLQSLEIEDE